MALKWLPFPRCSEKKVNFRHAMKKSIVLIICSLALGLATVAHAADSITYAFTGTSSAGVYPPNYIDGSTLTISGGAITTFDFTAIGMPSFSTPANTGIASQDVTSYGPSGWTGALDLNYLGFFEIDVTGDSFASPALQASIQGNWTAIPDGANTFALLGAAMVGLAAWRPGARRLN